MAVTFFRTTAIGALLLAVGACGAPRTPSLPSGAGTPFPDYQAAYDQAVQECRSATSLIAELGLSGRAGGNRLRGRITAGFAAPESIRLEAVALGRPIFILVSHNGDASLLLVREDRIVRDAPPEAIVEALAGVALTPADLRAAVAGCGFGASTPANGRMLSEDWALVDTVGAVTYLRRVAGRWRVGGASRGTVRMVYADFAAGRPSTIHVRSGSANDSADAAPIADIKLSVSQLEINAPMDAKAFEIQVPPNAAPLSIEELRRAGPLGDRAK